MKSFSQLEVQREILQRECDRAKTLQERNRLGQFATPPALASEIIKLALKLLPECERVRFLDPAFGTGSFYSALRQVLPAARIERATGFEVDRHYADAAVELWRGSGLDLHVADFTRSSPHSIDRCNLLVCNPPYVRHHHLSVLEKQRLRRLTRHVSGLDLSGLAGLYCYFLLLADAWVSEGAVCVWLIPSEFLDVNYGASLKKYISSNVTLLQLHRFDAEDVQFGDALVSSAVVCFRKLPPPADHAADFTFGGSLNEPRIRQTLRSSDLHPDSKWNGCAVSTKRQRVRLSDIFHVKRGLATGDNRFFILTRESVEEHRLPAEFLKPILPSPRYLEVDEIEPDEVGDPLVARKLYLLDCSLPEEQVRRRFPTLWKYLASGKSHVANGYLCRSRSPWYSQESRPAPLFLCTYMGRKKRGGGHALRFVFNHSKATAANVYLLLYPRVELSLVLQARPESARDIWKWLRSISAEVVLREGRVYGGGLHKIEPRELGNIPVDELVEKLGMDFKPSPVQLQLSSHIAPAAFSSSV